VKKQLSVAAAVLAAGLLGLGGCGGSSDSCRLDVQRDMDDGNFNAVINTLEPADSSCRSEYAGNNFYLVLASAYMGKSGVAVSDFVQIAIDSGASGNDAFKAFISNVDQKTDVNSLGALSLAKASVKSFNGGVDLNCTPAAQADYSYYKKDACMYAGMIGTVNASVTVSTLTTNVQGWIDDNATGTDDVNGNNNPDDMDAATCALNYAVDGNTTCQNDMTVMVKAPSVAFKDQDGNTVNTYESIMVTVGGTKTGQADKQFYKLISGVSGTATGSVAITDGSCTADAFAACSTADGTGCFACPITQELNATEITMTDTIVDGLNNTDGILGSIDKDSDLYKAVAKLKEKIDKNKDGVITTAEVIEYLQNN